MRLNSLLVYCQLKDINANIQVDCFYNQSWFVANKTFNLHITLYHNSELNIEHEIVDDEDDFNGDHNMVIICIVN